MERQAPMVRPGEIVGGKYRVERVLGEGGMGAVVVARHVHFDDRVALKLLHPHVAQNPELVARFVREGRAARQIRSEHVVHITDVDLLDNGLPYLVMEYLEGVDLAQLLHQRGPLPVPQAIDYLLQVCEALAEAHAQGIVHRDLKPGNLFVSRRPDGSACLKILDFGISKVTDPKQHALTTTSAIIGTPLYMSPEQLQAARDVDARSDLWALGVILYELVAGVAPFRGETLPQISVKIILEDPIPLHVSQPGADPRLEAILTRCLRKAREERFQHVGELAAALAPLAPAHAMLSVERIHRLTGLAPSALSLPPPAPSPHAVSMAVSQEKAVISVETMAAPHSVERQQLEASATVGVPIVQGAREPVLEPAFASAQVASPSTIGGTSSRLSAQTTTPTRAGHWARLVSLVVLGLCALGAVLAYALRPAPPRPVVQAKPVEERVDEPAPPPSASASESAPGPAASVSAPKVSPTIVPKPKSSATVPAVPPSSTAPASAPVVKGWGADTPPQPSTKPTAPPTAPTKSNEDL